jgi:1,4-alpha-glucan branching enzyme
MVRKATSRNGSSRVTFELPAVACSDSMAVYLCGDFNEWSTTATPLTRRKDGRFSTTLVLPAGQSYRYRFLVDEGRWENDWAADAYMPNPFGTEDSVLHL